MLAHLPQLRAHSIARCADGKQHYLRAAAALSTAAAAILPNPLNAAALALPQRLDAAGAFYAVHAAALLGAFAAMVLALFRFELSHRRTFARRRRLAAEAAALLRRRQQWAVGLPLAVLLCALGWLACCNAVLLCLER